MQPVCLVDAHVQTIRPSMQEMIPLQPGPRLQLRIGETHPGAGSDLSVWHLQRRPNAETLCSREQGVCERETDL